MAPGPWPMGQSFPYLSLDSMSFIQPDKEQYIKDGLKRLEPTSHNGGLSYCLWPMMAWSMAYDLWHGLSPISHGMACGLWYVWPVVYGMTCMT